MAASEISRRDLSMDAPLGAGSVTLTLPDVEKLSLEIRQREGVCDLACHR